MDYIHQMLSTLIVLVVLRFTFSQSAIKQAISYRLPENIFPEFYTLEILTNLADINQNFTFQGRVRIQIKVRNPTNKIVLHSKNLEIDEAHVSVVLKQRYPPPNQNMHSEEVGNESKWSLKLLNHCYHDDYELYIITVAENLEVGSTYTVLIPYKGVLNKELSGYYRSSYQDMKTKETRWIAVTQFESTDARRAFPCFDEPAFKARFQVNLGHINTRSSISNMRIISKKPVENFENWEWDQYEVTVPMSTYLLAFVISDFDNKVSPDACSVPFRIWARKDALDQVDYANTIGPRILDYFGNYFGIQYPLPKMEMIAIPDFSAGAMENWGLITYREMALLYDPKVSGVSSQPYVASVVAHELAHQWFGNLVTMKWWTDLWLNEGFATYVAALGVHYLHPAWNYLEDEVLELMSVFYLDSLKSSHPISVPIGHPKEIAQIFDSISYKKGSFVLRMMNLFLGEEVFKSGVSKYLNRHAYANAEQDDLWACLTEEAHLAKVLPECLTVKEIMDTWTLQTGYPLLTVVRNYEKETATICQEIFLSGRTGEKMKGKESATLNNKWWVPLSYTFKTEANFNDTHPKEWLSSQQKCVSIRGLPKEDWVIFNIKISGLYKVKYDLENWEKLISALQDNCENIAMLNRVQLIEDSLTLAKTGDIDYSIPFNILKYLVKEEEYLPWKSALKNLGFVDKMLKLQPTYSYFRAFMRNLLEDIYAKTSSQTYLSAPENLTKIKRQTMIAAEACKFEVGDCKESVINLFISWMCSSDPDTENPIPKDFRPHAYCTAIRFGGEKEWTFLWNRYLSSNVGNEKSAMLSALSCTRDISLLIRFLEWSIHESSGIRKQDSPSVFVSVSRSDVGYTVAKSFLKNRLVDIYNFYGAKSTRLGNYFSALAIQITDDSELEDLIRFTRQNEKYLQSSHRAVMQGLESAKINTEWRRKFYCKVIELLSESTAEKEKMCRE